jgi:antitoxin HicB
MGADALLTAMDFYFEDRRPVPPPSALADGERLIELPLSASAKVLLLNEMLEQKVRRG